jgi:hypothetical protein
VQIRNECEANDGRVSLVDIANALKVDFTVIEAACRELARHDTQFIISHGQLISRCIVHSGCMHNSQTIHRIDM